MKNSTEVFDQLLEEMRQLRFKKNKDYGESFMEAYDDFGFVAIAMDVGRKYQRLKNFAKSKKLLVKDETIDDTLRDMAVICVNALVWRRIRGTLEPKSKRQHRSV